MIGTKRVIVKGSERQPVKGARPAGPVDPTETIEVTIRVRGKNDKAAAIAAMSREPISKRAYYGPDDIEKEFGAAPGDLDKVEDFALSRGFRIVSRDPATRCVVVSGTVGDMARTFSASLQRYHSEKGTFRGRTGPLWVPEALDGIVEGVFGLDNRPIPRSRVRATANAAQDGQTGASFAKRYAFPAGTDGSGQCVAILELGGGFKASEVRKYLAEIGIGKHPRMVSISTGGAATRPDGNPNGDDGEVVLDVEVVAAAAPGTTIAVYYAHNSNQGFINGILAAVHDKQRKPSALSISWGMPEDNWTAQGRAAMDDALQSAALMGITVCVASGDHGTNDVGEGEDTGVIHVDYPAASPYALACGGTQIHGDKEVAWNEGNGWATGGGVSTVYPVPAWQAEANVPASLRSNKPGRGVPDVAASATNYAVLVDGNASISGGTSAVAPLWAALIACLNQKLGKRVGYLNPLLYGRLSTGVLRDITTGSNSVADVPGYGTKGYTSRKGWDPCTGLGVPDGEALAKALAS